MSAGSHEDAEHLVQMANDIGNFFRADPDRDAAIAGSANHIDKFWTRSMRRKIAAHGEDGLDELPREALRRLATGGPVAVSEPNSYGGDAG